MAGVQADVANQTERQLKAAPAQVGQSAGVRGAGLQKGETR